MVNSLYGGGAEKVLQTLLKNIDYQKYDITLYSMHREILDPTCYPNSLHYRVVFDKKVGKTPISSLFYSVLEKIKGKVFQFLPSSLFYRMYIHGKYDVEIAFIEGESTKIIAGSSNKKSKKIAWVHIDLISNPWTSFLYKNDEDEKKHYMKFDQICCVSEKVKEAFLQKYGRTDYE